MKGFESFLTVDQGIEYEQNLKGRKITVVLIAAKSSQLVDLLPHVAAVLGLMRSEFSGRLVRIPG